MKKTAILALALVASWVCPSSGRAGDGVVALQTADPPCPDDSGALYVDCGNGTVTDNRTGLVWLAHADCFEVSGVLTWNQAMERAAGLADQGPDPFLETQDCGLSDGSSAGEWRLPSAAEWEAMIADAGTCVPAVTNDSGLGCWNTGPSTFTEVESSLYWSSTRFGTSTVAWGADLASGVVTNDSTSSGGHLWPVRGGQ